KANGVAVGSNSSTYTVLEGDEGKTITVTVTASNDDGDTVIKTSSATGTVKDALPTLTTPTISSNDADNSGTTVREGDVLSAAASTRSDDTLSYQWKANGVAVGSNSSTYTVLEGGEGNAFTPITAARNHDAHPARRSSDPTGTVKDALPTLTTPTISSNDADNSGTTVREGDVLSAAASTRSDDTLSYQWKANGVAVGSNSSTYTVL